MLCLRKLRRNKALQEKIHIKVKNINKILIAKKANITRIKQLR